MQRFSIHIKYEQLLFSYSVNLNTHNYIKKNNAFQKVIGLANSILDKLYYYSL